MLISTWLQNLRTLAFDVRGAFATKTRLRRTTAVRGSSTASRHSQRITEALEVRTLLTISTPVLGVSNDVVFEGDAAFDSIEFSVSSEGYLQHNLGVSFGFNSATDLDSVTAGDQTRLISHLTSLSYNDSGINDAVAFVGSSTFALGSGNASVRAGTITVSAGSSITSGDGAISLMADRSVLMLTGAGLITDSGVITLQADDLAIAPLTASVDAGGGTVVVRSSTAAREIDLGSEVAGRLSLTDAELDRITAGVLKIGSSTSGRITISQSISPSDSSTFHLISGAGVSQSAPIQVSNLAIEAAGEISLQNSGNDADTIALRTSVGNISFEDADGFGIGDIDGVSGVGAPAGRPNLLAFNGDIIVNDTAAAIDVEGRSGFNMVVNQFGVNSKFTLASGANMSGGGVQITADRLDISGTINALSAVTLQPMSSGRLLQLGSATDTAANTLELSDGELDRITTSVLRLGGFGTGAISIGQSINPAASSTLHLVTAAGVNQTSPIMVSNLAVQAAGTVSLPSNNNANTVALRTTAGHLTFADSDGFTIGTVNGVSGFSASAGSPSLTALSGDVVLSNTTAAVDLEGAAGYNMNVTLFGANAKFTIANGASMTGAGAQISADRMDIAGNISTTAATTLQPATSGRLMNLGSTTDAAVNTLELSDGELDRITASTLRIGVSAGTISVSSDITRPSASAMQLISNGDILISGGQIHTNGGTLLLDPGVSSAAVRPTSAGTDVTASTLTFGGDLAFSIDGATADTQYTQLKVTGSVNLSGASLKLSGSYSPAPTESFQILNNDGSDPINGTFNGLAEGALVNINGVPFTLSYIGGDGNDVELLPNSAPTSVELQNAIVALAEDVSTSAAIKLGDVAITDDRIGTNNVSLSGPDAGSFELINGAIYLKAGTVLDYETQASYLVTIDVDDPSVGNSPDVFVNYTLNLTDTNDPPIAVDDVHSVDEDQSLALTVAQLTGNDIDVDSNTDLQVTSVSDATHGTVTLNNGVITFTPDANFHGIAGFDYTVSDGTATDVGRVTVTVHLVNDTPTANLANVTGSVPAGQSVLLDASGSSDIDGDSLTFVWDFGDNTSYSESAGYAPDGVYDGRTTHVFGANGIFVVNLTVSDGQGGSDVATTNVSVESQGNEITISGYLVTNVVQNGSNVSGDASLPIVGNVHLTGTVQDGQYSISTTLSSIAVGSFSVTNANVTLNNDGIGFNGTFDLPVLNAVQLVGQIQGVSQYSFSSPPITVGVGGYSLTNAIVTASYSGISVSGTASLPVIGEIPLNGSIQNANNYSLSATIPTVSVGSFSVTGASVTLSSSGINLSGTASLPFIGEIPLIGSIQNADNYSLTAKIPIPTVSVGPFTITGTTVNVSQFGLQVAGDADLPMLPSISVSGFIEDLDNYSFSTPVAIPDLELAGFSLSNNVVSFGPGGIEYSGTATIPLISDYLGDIELSGTITDDSEFDIKATLDDFELLDGLIKFDNPVLSLTPEAMTFTTTTEVLKIGTADFNFTFDTSGNYSLTAEVGMEIAGFQIDGVRLTYGTNGLDVDFEMPIPNMPLPASEGFSFHGSYSPDHWLLAGTYSGPITLGPIVLTEITVTLTDISLGVASKATVANLDAFVNADLRATAYFDGRFEAVIDVNVLEIGSFQLGEAIVTFGNTVPETRLDPDPFNHEFTPDRRFILTIDAYLGVAPGPRVEFSGFIDDTGDYEFHGTDDFSLGQINLSKGEFTLDKQTGLTFSAETHLGVVDAYVSGTIDKDWNTEIDAAVTILSGPNVTLTGYIRSNGEYHLEVDDEFAIAGMSLSQTHFELDHIEGFTFDTEWDFGGIFTATINGSVRENGVIEFHGDGSGQIGDLSLCAVHVDAELDLVAEHYEVTVGANVHLLGTDFRLNRTLSFDAGNWSPFQLEGRRSLPSPLNTLFPGGVSWKVDQTGATFEGEFKSPFLAAGFMVHGEVRSDGSLSVHGEADIPIIGPMILSGSINPNGTYSLSVNVGKTVSGVSLGVLTLSNTECSVIATLPIVNLTAKLDIKGNELSGSVSTTTYKGISFGTLTINSSSAQVTATLPIVGLGASLSITSTSIYGDVTANANKKYGITFGKVEISSTSAKVGATLPLVGLGASLSITSTSIYGDVTANANKKYGITFGKVEISTTSAKVGATLPLVGLGANLSITSTSIYGDVPNKQGVTLGSLTITSTGASIDASMPGMGSFTLLVNSSGISVSLNKGLAGATLYTLQMSTSGVTVSAWAPYIHNITLNAEIKTSIFGGSSYTQLSVPLNKKLDVFTLKTLRLYSYGNFSVEAYAPAVGTIWVTGSNLYDLWTALSDRLPKVTIDGPKVGGPVGEFGNKIANGGKKMLGMGGITAGAIAFFDANKNGRLDTFSPEDDVLSEPWTFTNNQGEFLAEVPAEFDINLNGILDDEDGQWVVVGGVYSATGLPAETVRIAPASWNMVTPVTTLVSTLMNDFSLSQDDASRQVLQAMGLPELDLASFDPLAELLAGNPLGAEVYMAHALLNDSIAQVSALHEANGSTPQDLSLSVVRHLANHVLTSTSAIDFGDASFIESIVRSVGDTTGQILAEELISGASSVIADTNRQFDNLDPNGGVDFIYEAERIKFVSQGAVTRMLAMAATGELDVTEVVAANTGDALTEQIAAAIIPPTLLVPERIVAEATTSEGAFVEFGVAANDIAGQRLSTILSHASGQLFAFGDTVVTASTTDSAGNTVSASFTISVVDTVSPVLSLPADLVVEASGPVGAWVALPELFATDLVDGAVAVTYDIDSGWFSLGTTVVTATAVDQRGNQTVETFNVVVADTTAPEIVTPGDVVVDPTELNGALVSFADATAVDAVDPNPTVFQDFSSGFFPVGVTTVEVRAIDSSGNQRTTSFTVTVRDSVAPTLVIPESLTLEATRSGGADVLDLGIEATDNADPSPLITFNRTALPLGTAPLMVTATDASGNSVSATLVVTVVDTLAPEISGIVDLMFEADRPDGALVSFDGIGLTDIADPNPVLSFNVAEGVFALGTTNVLGTATDAAGNVTEFSFFVTVQDTTAPEISGLSDVIVHADDDSVAVVPFPNLVVTDLADPAPAIVFDRASNVFELGTTRVTVTVTDASGNIRQASYAVTVVDPNVDRVLPAIMQVSEVREEGRSVSVTGRAINAATLADASDVEFHWTVFKNGDPLPFAREFGTDQTRFEFIPDDNGSYRIVLTMTSSSGISASDETIIDVVNLSPATQFTYDLSGNEVRLIGDASDLSIADEQAGFTYAWTVIRDDEVIAEQSSADPEFQFTPAGAGRYSARLIVTDKDGTSASFESPISVAVPVAENMSLSTDEDTTLDGQLAGTDSDNDSLVYLLVDSPSHGSISVSDDGSFNYVPDANFHGSDTFTFLVTDGHDVSNVATVMIQVLSINDGPVAIDAATEVFEDTPLTGSVAALDADQDELTYSLADAPSHGSVTITADGSFVYTPDPDFYGEDSFTFEASDGQSKSIGIVQVSVTPVNDRPTAEDQVIQLDEDSSVVGQLLAGDVDENEDELIFTVVSGPNHGTLVLSETGEFTYQPDPDFHGVDEFTFRASHGFDFGEPATVRLEVTAVNDAPIALDGTLTTLEDTAVIGELLATDVDGDELTYSIVIQPAHGSVTLNADGSFVYLPAANYYGLDRFSFRVNDGTDNSVLANVVLTITPVNDGPQANSRTVATDEDRQVSIRLTGFDIDGDLLSYYIVEGPAHGTLSGTAPNLIYTPDPDFSGADSFLFRVNDGILASYFAVVNINVTAVNDAPQIVTISSDHSNLEFCSIDGYVTITGTLSDPDVLDQHTVLVDWGDGTIQTVSVDQIADTFAGLHEYATGGLYTIRVKVTDNFGAESEWHAVDAFVEGVGVVNGTLYIIGTNGRDDVKLKVNEKKDQLSVDAKFAHGRPGDGCRESDGGSDRVRMTLKASEINRVVAFLRDGDDKFNGGGDSGSDECHDGGIRINQLVFGGRGDDDLRGGQWNDALFGEAGDDDIFGGGGDDILVGGHGKDKIDGGKGQDLLIGGILDNNFEDSSILNDIDAAMIEWARGDLADVFSFFGPIIDDSRKDSLFRDRDDEIFAGAGDSIKK